MKSTFEFLKKTSNKIIYLLAVIFILLTVTAVAQISYQTKRIYNHPQVVYTHLLTIRSSSVEMNSYLSGILVSKHNNPKEVMMNLEKTYARQDNSFKIIRDAYIGDPNDIIELEEALAALRRARIDIIYAYGEPLSLDQTQELIAAASEPYNSEFQRVLDSVINKTQEQIAKMQRTINAFATVCIVSAVIIGLILISVTMYMGRKEHLQSVEILYSQELLNLLSHNIDDVYYVYDYINSKIEFISENCSRTFDYSVKDVMNDITVVFRNMTPQSEKDLHELFSKQPFHEPVEQNLIFEKDGSQRTIKMRVYPVKDNKTLARYIIMASDQTETNKYQQVLKDALANAEMANESKRNFFSRMSHEIRTPMNAIVGMTTLAKQNADNKERVEDCLNKIAFSSKHLLALINDILDMSKIESGKLSVSYEPFSLKSLVESVVSIIYPQTVANNQNFEVYISGITHETLTGDLLRINQILLNLLSNALKFTAQGGSIILDINQISVEGSTAYLRFIVRDTGIGMSAEFLTRLFTPFEQADSGISQKFGGTGLGMAITNNLVQIMGGNIDVESEEGKGTSFAVRLPFGIAEEGEENYKADLRDLNILVADDDEESCKHQLTLLREFGIDADNVSSGRQAVKAIQGAHKSNRDYDICFIDWQMPDMNGIETAKEIRGLSELDDVLIILSAYDIFNIEQQALEAGVNGFINKPFFISSLYNAIASVTGRAEVKSAVPEKAEEYDFTGHKFLLAEDNELNQEIAIELIKIAKGRVDCADNGRMAVEMFEKSEPGEYSLILMDVQMPEMNGYEATRAIRLSDKGKKIPIIAMTANAFTEDVAMASEAGMNGHVAKPIEVDLLYRTIAAELFKQSEGRII